MLTSSGLPIPKALCDLIVNGFWPMNEQDIWAQELEPLVPLDKFKLFAPEFSTICFYHPPFYTVSECKKGGEDFWDWPGAAAHEIDTDLTLLIGDFGSGSDAPIALDYRRDIANPSVIRLKYLPQADNWCEVRTRRVEIVVEAVLDGIKALFHPAVVVRSHWVEIAPTFDDFTSMIVR